MEVTRYTSFKEIDARLRMLQLQREIDKESLKLNITRAKYRLRPAGLKGGLGRTLQKIILAFAVRKLSQWFQKGTSHPHKTRELTAGKN